MNETKKKSVREILEEMRLDVEEKTLEIKKLKEKIK
jgi:hypothetical protein